MMAALLIGALAGLGSIVQPIGGRIYGHLAIGRDIAERGLFRAEGISWAPAGAAPLDQWLGDVLWYGAYALGGWDGVLALRTLGIAALAAVVTGAAVARAPQRPLSSVTAAVPAVLLTQVAWVSGPELVGAVALAAFVLLLQTAAPLILAAGALLLWAALDGSLLPPGAPLDPQRLTLGWSVPDVLTLEGALSGLVLGLVMACAVFAPPARARDIALLLPAVLLSLTAYRHLALLGIAAAPYLAEKLPVALRAAGERLGLAVELPLYLPAVGRPATTVLGGALFALLLAASLAAAAPPPERGFPARTLSELPAGPGLLEDPDWSGWLAWHAPGTPVMGLRAAGLSAQRDILELRAGWREELARRGVRHLLVRPHRPIAVRARDLGWSVLSSGPEFVLIEVP